MPDLFHSNRIKSHLICPCCHDEMLDDEDCIEINLNKYHRVCIDEMDRIELLKMVGADIREVD